MDEHAPHAHHAHHGAHSLLAQWTAALRAGYLVQPSILLYGVVGMQGTARGQCGEDACRELQVVTGGEIAADRVAVPALRLLLETIIPERAAMDGFEVEHQRVVLEQRVKALQGRRGQRMVDSCMHCASCGEGLEQYCDNGFTGTYNGPVFGGENTFGGYSSRIVVKQKFVLRISHKDNLQAVAPLLWLMVLPPTAVAVAFHGNTALLATAALCCGGIYHLLYQRLVRMAEPGAAG